MSGFYFSVLAAAGGSVAFLFCLWFFQLSSYRAAEYIVLFRTGKGISLILAAFAFLCCSIYGNFAAMTASALFFEMLSTYFLKQPKKVALKRTGRFKRLFVVGCFFIVVSASVYPPSALFFSFAAPAVSAVVLSPYEKIKNAGYIEKARNAYSAVPVRVCITGSYGKTTVKNMCFTILSEIYKTFATPLSYNTPLGLALASDGLSGDERIAVVEMGARRVGDIAELTKIVIPTVAVVTGIAPQHIKTFRTLDNVAKEKLSLLNALKDKSAFIYNADDENLCAYLSALGIEGLGCGIGGNYVRAHREGEEWVFSYGNTEIRSVVKVLGEGSVGDMAMAVGVAAMLKVPAEKIAAGIGKIRPSPHRMEYFEKNGVTIIDDSYNCNIQGASEACKVLRQLGKRSFVITAGIVEGGKKAGELNRKIGSMLSETAYLTVAVGVNAGSIREGYLSGKKKGEFMTALRLDDAVRTVSERCVPGDVILFMNDLPDNYV